jgi:hypothetical protein
MAQAQWQTKPASMFGTVQKLASVFLKKSRGMREITSFHAT